MTRRWALPVAIAMIVLASLVPGMFSAAAQRGSETDEWRDYAGDARGLKYSPLSQINKNNVKDLQVAWRWASSSCAATAPTTSRCPRPGSG